MSEAKAQIFPREVLSRAAETKPGDAAAYRSLVEILAQECRSRAQGTRYFPISILRETCRQSLRAAAFESSTTLFFYTVFCDAVLSAMASSALPEVCRTGQLLQAVIGELVGLDPSRSVVLRLHYVAGLTPGEISKLLTTIGSASMETVLRTSANELEARGLTAKLLSRQNLCARGELTLILEKVRDGQQPIGDAVVHQDRKLKLQASHLLRMEGGSISLDPEDLVNEMYLRLPKDVEKSPLNHREFEALARRIMRHILIDRARKPVPTQSRFSTELSEDLAQTSDALDDRLMMRQLVHVVNEVIHEMRGSDPETAEMLHATLYRNVDQKYLAKLYGVSISTVKRRIKEGRDLIRKHLATEPSK